ncbi:hypothetical protein [uncultured Phocaeicola sp.]|uniref:hypothetical protein n=1 Tax=uncultured Phocaeicola sp. TaxID=990718 RepID=UPI0025D192FD|nr:hypothetical protein [uncultured Phocaeicola sp.]
MTMLFEMLNNDSIKAIAKNTVKVGDVYRIKMDERNGIKPKAGDKSRNKYFIVLGFDSEGNAYGGVIINSEINPNIPQSMKNCHLHIECSKYSFLDHDSYVDCSKLKIANIEKFGKWQYLGFFSLEDVQLITTTIQGSPNETKEHLAMFGL